MFVFLSYKSEDANLVRQVAEQLIGCGLDVWVNEYRILAGDYEKFQDGINDGLSRATHAIVFTNNRWAGAEWCRYEMNGLLARIPDRSRIVEVAIPWEDKPREVFPDLLGRPAVVYRGDPRRPSHTGVHDVVVAILDRLGFGTGMTALPATAPRADWLPSYGVTYDRGPFDIWLERSRKQVTARLLQSDAVLGLRTIVYH
ncbi:MAG: Ankyrin, partial [Candidatus Aminicenantes bacterium]|nr:Ankyrin [Candidatus Aminicenantes bacterium]